MSHASHPELADVLTLVGPYCDLEERLARVPPSARMRGLWFKVIESEVKERGVAVEYRNYFPADDFKALTYYGTSDYLVRAAVAGALIAGAPHVHEGLHRIARGNAERFAATLLGRTLIRLLSPDPVRVIQQGIAARRQTITHGQWVMTRSEPGLIVVELQTEYMWIDSHVAGSCQGTFTAIGVDADIDARLTDPFNGELHMRWNP